MKGPSLEAIKKFKEQQELKRREDEERKCRERLSVIEHRALQGDRKAKRELKKIEEVKEARNKNPTPRDIRDISQPVKPKEKSAAPKPKGLVTDFNELMRLANGNKNEVKKPEPPRPAPSAPSRSSHIERIEKPVSHNNKQSTKQKQEPPSISAMKVMPIKSESLPSTSRSHPRAHLPPHNPRATQRIISSKHNQPDPRRRAPMALHARMRHHDEDEYDDDFVVDDDECDEDSAQDALRDVLSSVFRYDRRRCDLREQEIEREYAAIGEVRNFEDLEREERRAARKAAAEDARALREEEERKRLKRIRLGKSK